MKLTDLHPRWAAEKDAPPDAKQGVSFLCPHCALTGGSQRIAVWFTPTICGNTPVTNLAQAQASHPEHHHFLEWQRPGGETFETLTLSPSIDASKSGHWHGFIRGGEVA